MFYCRRVCARHRPTQAPEHEIAFDDFEKRARKIIINNNIVFPLNRVPMKLLS